MRSQMLPPRLLGAVTAMLVLLLALPALPALAEDGSGREKALSFVNHTDGSVEVDGVFYGSMIQYQQSDAFRTRGARCGSLGRQELLEQHPWLLNEAVPSDCSFSQTVIQSEYEPGNGPVYTVPIVFHMVQRTDGTGFVSESLVLSQLDIFNEDFRALPGTLGAPGTDTRIQFELATVDPNGNPTTGINYYTNNSWFQDPGPGASNAMKQSINWDPTRYFNVYSNNAAGNLGYATFPQTDAGTAQDGIVLLWSSVGRDAPQGGIYDQGRTGTHEAGHYFGLFHVFQGGCGSAGAPYTTGDLVADTAAQSGQVFDCPAGSASCGSPNPIDNYMNYTQDTCMDKFTPEQANRMRCAIANFRADLVAGGGCTPQPVADPGPDQTITEGQSASIGTAAQGGHSYSWSPGGATSAQITVSPTSTTTYTVTATTSCGSAQDSVTVTVVPAGGGGLLEDFEGSVAGWSTSGLWHLTDDSSCATPGYSSPTHAFYYGQDGSCDYDTGATTAGSLVSPTILGITSSSTLTFDYFRQVESAGSGSWDTTAAEVSTNGSTWTTVWSRNATDTSENAWVSSGAVSLASFAGGSIQVRFRFDSVDGSFNTFTGWFIDDVVVTGGGGGGCTSNGQCDNGDFCDGSETCNLGTGLCEAGTPPNCSDGVSCTVDSCNEGTDSCDNVPSNALCDNGLFCDGSETCNAVLGCQAGTAPNCSDGVSCTVDSCNEGTDSCDNVPNDGLCDDGLFCNGAETCNATLDCQAGSDPCPGGSCNEAGDFCEGGGGCPAGSIDFGSFALTSYADQNVSNNTQVLDGGDTLRVIGNTWVRSTQSFSVTANTVVAFDFTGTAEGEIHAIGFDENDNLNDAARHFQFWGDQNWTGGGHIGYNPQYSGSGTQSFSIPVGQTYTGNMFLVFTGDDDASAASDATFSCVRVIQPPPASCTVDEDFESGSAGWVNEAASTCSTGDYVLGNPTQVVNGGVTTQLAGSSSGTGSLFTATNTSAGVNDVDGGNCILGSPTWSVANASTLSVASWHGQRDSGGDASGDFFRLEYSTNGGSTWTVLRSNGDTTSNAAWSTATAQIPAGSSVRVRVQCSDGTAGGDLVECGIDDVSICDN